MKKIFLGLVCLSCAVIGKNYSTSPTLKNPTTVDVYTTISIIPTRSIVIIPDDNSDKVTISHGNIRGTLDSTGKTETPSDQIIRIGESRGSENFDDILPLKNGTTFKFKLTAENYKGTGEGVYSKKSPPAALRGSKGNEYNLYHTLLFYSVDSKNKIIAQIDKNNPQMTSMTLEHKAREETYDEFQLSSIISNDLINKAPADTYRETSTLQVIVSVK